MWRGHVVSIHVAGEASAPMDTLAEARAVPGRGLEGDRYFLGTGFYSNRPGVGGREITLIETETLDALAKTLNIKLPAVESRRNIAMSGAPLNHLVDREFWVGEVRLLGTRLCEPCMHLEQLTGLQGVMSGLVHRGGLRARILNEGVIRTGDAIRRA
ncbi:MAG: MOSC domain-containing protein [Candidatus Rokubacteria bacterium]|nr:MOSC domain-containing protein [Candidatus Rokubacteria bacterium]